MNNTRIPEPSDDFVEPTDADRLWVEQLVVHDEAITGGGFTIKNGRSVIWLAVTTADLVAGRPHVLCGYPVIYRSDSFKGTGEVGGANAT